MYLVLMLLLAAAGMAWFILRQKRYFYAVVYLGFGYCTDIMIAREFPLNRYWAIIPAAFIPIAIGEVIRTLWKKRCKK